MIGNGNFHSKRNAAKKQIQNATVAYVDKRYMSLVAGILEQAEKDLAEAIIKKQHQRAASVKRFFLSEWGQALSGDNGQFIIDRIYNELQKERETL